MPCFERGVGRGRATGIPSIVSRSSLKSLTLAPATAKPIGTPAPSVNRLRLVPRLARSVGFGPVFSPAQRGLGHRSVGAQPAPIDALQFVVFHQSQAPHAPEYTLGRPLLKSIVSGRTRTDARRVQGVPLAAGSKYKEDRVHTDAVRLARPTAAEEMRVQARRQQRLDPRPQFIRNRETRSRPGHVEASMLVKGPPWSYRQNEGYSDRLLAKNKSKCAARANGTFPTYGQCVSTVRSRNHRSCRIPKV